MKRSLVMFLLVLTANMFLFSNSLESKSEVHIQSKHSQNYLRGAGCTCKIDGPCGKVNSQSIKGLWETWVVHEGPNGSFCLESKKFPDNFLTLDTSDCK